MTNDLVNGGMIENCLRLGAQYLQSGSPAQAKTMYEQILRIAPRHTEAMKLLSLVLFKQGDSSGAVELIELAISQEPRNASLYVSLGSILQDIGQRAGAIRNYQSALDIDPKSANTHNSLGRVLFDEGRYPEAIGSYQEAIALAPDFALAYNNLGVALRAEKRLGPAVLAFEQAVLRDPNYAEAYKNLGDALLEKELPDAALRAYTKAIEIIPSFTSALFGAAFILKGSEPERAISLYRRGLEDVSEDHDALFHLGDLLQYQGDAKEARECFYRYLQLSPTNGAYILMALLLPTIMGTVEEVQTIRAEFERNLEVLIAEKIPLLDPVREFGRTSFLLAYHGLNDKLVQQRIAYFYEQACPSLMYVAPHCLGPRFSNNKKKIGFLSKFITRHSVAQAFQGFIIRLIALGKFDIYLISNTDANDELIHSSYPNIGERFLRIPDDLEMARQKISALELDVLIYMDIGMETLSYFLAYSRLAHVQCVAGGHPVTTGIRNLDYYLSSRLIEPPNGDDHYSEVLVRLPFGLLFMLRPDPQSTFKSRAELDLPVDGRIYICPLVLHKIHPDFDVALERILQLDTEGHIVLFADKNFAYRQVQLEKRFCQTICENVRKRIIFIPWIDDANDFISAINVSDVVIDSFHFGVGTTIIPIALAGTPFVTMPSNFMRGRVGMYFAQLLNLNECVADSMEEYARLAVSIASNPVERDRIKQKFLSNNHVLFENPRAIEDMVGFLSGLSASHLH